jgi:chromosome condensin MukBEF ATPase and DNA-binding subunit MukB
LEFGHQEFSLFIFFVVTLNFFSNPGAEIKKNKLKDRIIKSLKNNDQIIKRVKLEGSKQHFHVIGTINELNFFCQISILVLDL